MHFLSKKISKYTSLITKCSYKTSLPNRWHYPIEIDTDQIYIHLNKAKWRLFFNTRMPRIIPPITFNPRVVNRR